MNFKENIAEITIRINDLEMKSANLQTDAFNLRQEREQLLAKMILEENLLANTRWEIQMSGNNIPHLEFLDAGKSTSMEVIEELARKDYHCWFDLISGIQLRFDDNEVSLHFKESKQIMPFVKRCELKLTGTGISDRLSELKREVSALELIVHSFNL
jgi:hypothetical protein